MLAGSPALHIRWVPHLCDHPVVQQLPVFQHQQVHWEGGGGGGGGWLLHTGLYWLAVITCGRIHMSIHSTIPHRNTQIWYGKKHNKHPPLLSSQLRRDKEEMVEGKSQGPQQIGCLVAHGDNIWERSVCVRADFIENRAVVGFQETWMLWISTEDLNIKQLVDAQSMY